MLFSLGLAALQSGDLNGARAALLRMLRATVNLRRRVVIFVDACTHMDNPRGTSWVLGEAEMPTGVQLVMGGQSLDAKLAQQLQQDKLVLLTEDGAWRHSVVRRCRLTNIRLTLG